MAFSTSYGAVTLSRGRVSVAIKATKHVINVSRLYGTRHRVIAASSSAEAGPGDGLVRPPAVPELEGGKEVEEAMDRVKEALNRAENAVSNIEYLPSARLPTRVRPAWHDTCIVLACPALSDAEHMYFLSQCRWIRLLGGAKQYLKCCYS